MNKARYPKIPVEQMVIGLTVKLPLSWTDHPFIFNKIKLEQAAQIELIKGLGVPYVYVLSGEELISEQVDTVDADDLDFDHDEQVEAVDVKSVAKKSMRLGQQRYIKAINDARSVFSKVISDPEGMYREAAGLVETLVEHLYENPTPRLSLVTDGDGDLSVTQHGVSIAVMSMIIAKAHGLDKSKIRDIALGSILHDIGKLKVPDTIRRKRTELSPQEANFLKMHPNLGYDLLNRHKLLPKEALDIVLHHHELQDGSGYPDGLSAKKIPLQTQIVALVNDFERLLHHSDTPQIALGTLFKLRAGKHDEALITQLIKVLGIYPPGAIVRLSDGMVGKVMLTSSEVKKPHVWCCTESGSEPSLRFLIEENVEIVEAVKDDELSQSARKTLQTDNKISFYFSSFEG